MVNQCTKFEVSRFTRYEAMNGSAKRRKWGGLRWLGALKFTWTSMPPNHLKPPQTPRHKETRLFFGGVLEKGYCRDARTDFDAKYVKRCGSAQGSAFWGLRNQYQTTPFSALCAAIHSFVTGEPSYFTNLCYADDIFSGVKRELLDTVKARNLAYYGHTMRKQGSCLEKKIMQGIMPGARRRGRPRTVHCNPPTS